MQYILLQGIKLEDFLYQIEKTIEGKVNEKLEQLRSKPTWEYLSRKEVCKILKVSLPTLDRMVKESKVRSYRLGTTVRFRSDEVEQAVRERKYFPKN
jgi:excisionase family DNA binding protein